AWGSSAATAYCRMGSWLVENVWTLVDWAAWGRDDRMSSTAWTTAWRAVLGSVPSLNVRMIRETPWLELDVTALTPLTPCTALVVGSDTSRSTTPGEAPGSGVIRTNAGSEMSGRRSCWTWVAANTPAPNRIATASSTTVFRRREKRVRRLMVGVWVPPWRGR